MKFSHSRLCDTQSDEEGVVEEDSFDQMSMISNLEDISLPVNSTNEMFMFELSFREQKKELDFDEWNE